MQAHGKVPPSWQRKVWQCACGQSVFFRNSYCLKCQSALGYLPGHDEMLALEPMADGTWRAKGKASFAHVSLQRCANFNTAATCNWLLEQGDGQLCAACKLTRTIPDLSIAENAERWQKVELAKRRVVAQLINLGLPITGMTEDPAQGLVFDFLGPDSQWRPQIGHSNGVITLDVEEANDAYRERVRNDLREPYRTLIGHFRHELGHYYWNRLIAESDWLQPCRAVFGDERQDYEQALKRYYEQGAKADWHLHHVSAYASVHPWEDWAESWAHYLHVLDAIDTAASFGMDPHHGVIEFRSFANEALFSLEADDAAEFLSLVNGWVQLATMLNELSQSMGLADFYPFVLSIPAVKKLHFIHCVVGETVASIRSMYSPGAKTG